MAKKVVATLKTGTGKHFTKCIKMVKSDKTGAYMFKEGVIRQRPGQGILRGEEISILRVELLNTKGIRSGCPLYFSGSLPANQNLCTARTRKLLYLGISTT